MSETTVYKVLTVYEAADKSSRALGEIGRAADNAARSTMNLSSVLKTVAGIAMGGMVFGKAKSMLIDYNNQMEQSKTVIAGMLTLYSSAGIEKSWDRAGKSVERFQEMAKKSSLTTKDLVETMSGLTRPLMQAGVGVKDIEQMSFGVANAAKAFGMSGAIVGMDIEQAITSRVSMRDRFTRNILAQKEVGYTDYEKFNKLSTEKRVEVLKKALTSKAITDLAKKQGEDTFSGVLSTLQDNLEIFASKVGMPLFRAITNEVKGWNGWIEKNSRKIDEFGKAVSQGLLKTFVVVKDVFTFMYNHADVLIKIAKAWAAIKLGNMLGGALGGSGTNAVGAISSLVQWFQKKKPTDRFNPETGEYEYDPGKAGKGRQAVGGVKGALKHADQLGMMFGGGYMVGDLLAKEVLGLKGNELRHLLMGVSKDEKQQAAMAEMDKWFEKAKEINAGKGGIAGSGAFNQMQGRIMELQEEMNKAGDAHRAKLREIKRQGPLAQVNLLGDANFEAEQAKKSAEIARLQGRHMGDTAMAITAFSNASSKMKKAQIDAIGIEKAQAIVMDLMVKRGGILADSLRGITQAFDPLKPGAIEQFNQRMLLLLNPSYAAELALRGVTDPDADFKGQKPPKTEVNITIQRVMAKDPNKWLAEMDDMVARRTRARTRAKGAWKNTPK